MNKMQKIEVKNLTLDMFILAFFIVVLSSGVMADTIFSDTFESGTLNGWTLTKAAGANDWTASQTDPFQGSWHAQSQPQSTSEPASIIERTISTTGYNTIIFNYSRKLIGLDVADEFQAEWFDGSSWTILEQTGSESEDNAAYLSKQFSLPAGASNNANFRIKFECTAGAVSEFCRVDNVLVQGTLIDTTSPIVTINFPTNGAFYKTALNFNVSLNENGSVMYSLNNGINNFTMTGNQHPFGTIFNATNNSISDGTYTFQVYANDTNGNKNYTTSAQFTYDSINPSLTLSHPQNTSYNTNNLQINFTVSDSNLQSCWYTTNSGITNISLSNCQNTSYTAQQGSTTLVVYTNDSSNNINSSSVTFFVDSIIPLISFSQPTLANNSILTQSSIFINTTITEINFANITFTLYNQTSLINQTIYPTQTLSINFTSLKDSIYFYNISIKDTTNNQNTTETRTIVLDTTPPTINITLPKNLSYNSIQTQLNYTITDTNLNSCWYTTNGGTTNSSITCGNNISSLSSQGSNTWRIYSNDSANNINSSTITFFIDSITPTLSILTPTEGSTFGTNQSLELNFTISDTNLQSCWYHIDSSANSTIPNCINATFNTTSGQHTLYLYANDSLNNKALSTVNFTISIGSPTITQQSPINIYLNTNDIKFNYTASDVDLDSCELWGNFTGTFTKNQTNNTLISGQQAFFSLNLTDSSYIWSVRCNDTLGNTAMTTNKTFYIDTILPIISLTEPTGTKTSRNNLLMAFTVSDTNLQSCWYNIYRGINIEISNTSISCSIGSTSFNVTIDANFALNFYANDSAGNINNSTTIFIVDTSSPSGGNSGGSSGGGGSGGGGGIVPTKPSNESREIYLSIAEIKNFAIKRGTTATLDIEVTNNEKRFLNNCKLPLSPILQKWLSNNQEKGLSPGEKFRFTLNVNIPLNSEIGKFSSEIAIECEEGKKSSSLEMIIYRNSFEATLTNYNREVDRVKVNYVLEEFAQVTHDIILKYDLFDSEKLLVTTGEERILLNPGERQKNQLEIQVPKGLTGKYDLKMLLTDQKTENTLNQTLDLQRLTGLAITENNRKTLSTFGIILIASLIIFFITKIIYKKIKIRRIISALEEKHGKKIIKLDIKHANINKS